MITREIDRCPWTSTVGKRLDHHTVVVFDRSAVFCMVKIDLIFHRDTTNEDGDRSDEKIHSLCNKTHCRMRFVALLLWKLRSRITVVLCICLLKHVRPRWCWLSRIFQPNQVSLSLSVLQQLLSPDVGERVLDKSHWEKDRVVYPTLFMAAERSNSFNYFDAFSSSSHVYLWLIVI